MKKISMVLMALALMAITPMMAQHKHEHHETCSFEECREAYYKKNPAAREAAENFEKQIQAGKFLKSRLKSQTNYIIPVVFHIYGNEWIGKSGTDYAVTDARIKQALKDINENFAGFNDEVDPRFATLEGGSNIEFRLAQLDPDGNPTTGIIHHEYAEGFGLNGTTDNEIARYAWDNYKYMNVHIQLVLKNGGTTNSGIAWFPDTRMSDEGTARVVYNGKYIIYSPPASSLTHEFGHFFGLEHTFKGGCVHGAENGDKVADTPPTAEGMGCDRDIRNCFGDYINSENHMDYNPCEKMFTKGQVERMEAFMNNDARVTLWQDSNLVATGVKNELGKRILFNYQDRLDEDLLKLHSFQENFTNDGSILNKKKIKAVDGALFNLTGWLQEGVHFSTENVPEGLTTKIKTLNDTVAVIEFDGNANNHSEASTSKVKIIMLSAAIQGGVSDMEYKTGTYTIKFNDPYTTYYETFCPYSDAGVSMPNMDAKSSNFSSFAIGGLFTIDLRNYDGNNIIIDNFEYKMEVLCNTGSTNVKLLPEDYTITANSGEWFTKPEMKGPRAMVSNEAYTTWHGQNGYAAFRVATINGKYLYGWAKILVNDVGTYAQMQCFGINPEPDGSVKTGVQRANVTYSNDRFLESVENDNTISNHIVAKLANTTFAKSGLLEAGVDYTISNVPQGTTFEVEVVNSTTAHIRMAGEVSNRWVNDYLGWGYYRFPLNFEFTSDVLNGTQAQDLQGNEYNFGLEYIGETFSKRPQAELYEIYDRQEKGGWISVRESANSYTGMYYGYQFGLYEEGDSDRAGVKLLSYRKGAVANENYEIIPLDSGTVIGPNSNWKGGREYHSGTGQHMIDCADYTAWRQQIKYLGIRFMRSGRMHYGWIELDVNNSGKRFRFREYAICGKPETSIVAGSTQTDAPENTVAPTRPTDLSVTEVLPYEVSLSWNAATDDEGYVFYDVYHNDIKIKSTDSNSCQVEGLEENTVYNFTVIARDINSNESEASNVVTVRTKPILMKEFFCDARGLSPYDRITKVKVNDFVNATDREPDGYGRYIERPIELTPGSQATFEIHNNWVDSRLSVIVWIDYNGDLDVNDPDEEVIRGKTINGKLTQTITIPETASGAAGMRVSMNFDGYPAGPCANVASGEIEDYVIDFGGSSVDTQAPTAPSQLSAQDIQTTSVRLEWTASTDNIGVVGYDVYHLSNPVGTTTNNSIQISDLLSGEDYVFTVKAKDAANNVSAASNELAVTTLIDGAGCEYCEVKGRNQQYEWITSVTLAGQEKTSGKDANGYGDHTAESFQLVPGNTTSITLNTNVDNVKETFKVWIDYNKDCDFDDPGEEVFSAFGQGSVTGQFEVPENVQGPTRMRISLRYNTYPTGPCNDVSYGEIEDYTVSFATLRSATSIGDEVGNQTMTLLPNPVKDILTIETDADQIESIEVYSINGAKINVQANGKQIDVSHLPTGIYLVKLSVNGKNYVERFVKE